MHRPEPLEISLRRSRLLAAWIVIVASGTFAVVLALPIDGWIKALTASLLALWAAFTLRRLEDGNATDRLRLDGDRSVLVTGKDGRTRRGRVLAPTYVGGQVTTLVWRPEGRRLARTECVLPDGLSPEDFRRMRVLLRYGRSEPTQGAPPSHA